MKRVLTEWIPNTMSASMKARGGNSKSPEGDFFRKKITNCFCLGFQTVRVIVPPCSGERTEQDVCTIS